MLRPSNIYQFFVSVFFFGFHHSGVNCNRPYLSAADNFSELKDALEGVLSSVGAQATSYVRLIQYDVDNEKAAVESGLRRVMVESVVRGALDTKEGSHHVKHIPKLYQLANDIGPKVLMATATKIWLGEAGGEAITNMVGECAKQLREAMNQPPQ